MPRRPANPSMQDEGAPLLTERYPPEDENKRESKLLTVCPFILINEMMERLAFYGLSTNLVIYLTRIMGARPAIAATQVNLFEGTCYLTPLLGAWLADSRWGRYKTILVFSSIYFMGMASLAASAWIPGLTPAQDGERASFVQNAMLFGSLYVVALGTGGIKPNVSAFGADQFDESDPQDRKEKDSFFNWFYLAINLGSLVAVTTLVYIQESISWAIGFAIPAACMALAVLVFVAGSSRYVHVEPTESPMTRVVRVLWAAAQGKWRKRQQARQARRTPASSSGYTGPVNLPPGGLGIGAAMRKTYSYQWLDEACEEPVDGARGAEAGIGGFTATQVEEVRMVVRMLPIFFTTILYWTIYMQMGSFFVEQGSQMDRRLHIPSFSLFGRRVSSASLTIPAASLALFNTISIIALIPVYDKGLVPLLARFGRKLSLLQRIGWGLLVCVLAMLAAAAVEWHRLRLYRAGHVLHPRDGAPHSAIAGLHSSHSAGGVVDLNVFWQVPQYLLIGLSEVLASIGQLEFFYDQAPDVMRSCSMALQLLSTAAGSYLSGLVVVAVGAVTARGGSAGWLADDLNHGRLDLFFLFLAGLMLLNLAWFAWVSRSYEYKAVDHRRLAVPVPKPQHPQWLRPQPVAGVQNSHEIDIAPRLQPEEDVGIYGRSVTFTAQSPALPAPFR